MKYAVITIMSLFSVIGWGMDLQEMDRASSSRLFEKSCKDLKRLQDRLLDAAGDAFQPDLEDPESLIKIVLFKNTFRIDQSKCIANWVEKEFRFNLWNPDLVDRDIAAHGIEPEMNNFIQIISNRESEKKICVDKLVETSNKKAENIFATIISIDDDCNLSLQDDFLVQEIERPTVIAINKELVLNKAVMKNLRERLEPLGEEYEADEVLKKLNGFEKEQLDLLLSESHWPEDLQNTIRLILTERYMPGRDTESKVRLCFFDSLPLDQQPEYITYWIKEICRSKIQTGGYYHLLQFGEPYPAIKLISGDTIESILIEQKNGDIKPNTVLTILTLNSADDINRLLPLVGTDIETSLVIGINQALLNDEIFVGTLVENLVKIKDKAGVSECLEMLKDKCSLQQQNTDNKTDKKINNSYMTGSLASILSTPMAKFFGIVVLAGSSIALLAYFSNYFKSSEKATS